MRISQNDKLFILKALQDEVRIDGRHPFDSRKIHLTFGPHNDLATVKLGSTRVTTKIIPVLDAPYPDRPNEGTLRFNVEYSPMASQEFDSGRPSEGAMETIRLLEQVLRNSRAVDREALCVLAGQKVWHLDINVTVLDHAGNLTDACLLSAVAALMVFKRPEVEVDTSESGAGTARTTVLSPAVREPLPLSLHQLPLSATFALFGDGEFIVIDPNFKEEAAASGIVTVIVNTNSDVCTIKKTSGVGISAAQVQRFIHLASNRAGEVMQELKEVLQKHEASRVSMRVRRHASAPQQQGSASRSVTVLPPGDVTDGVQLSAMPDQEPESEEESSSGEEDMSEGDPVSMIGSNTELPAASAAPEEGSCGQAALQELLRGGAPMCAPAHGDRQSGAKTSERPVASKRTAIGVPKQQKQDLDFLDGESDLEDDLVHMRKALQTKDRQGQL